MTYELLNQDKDKNLIERIFAVRWIDDNIDSFLNPTYKEYWWDPFLITGMKKAVDRILKAIENKEKIMIFGDYDVDGITSSYSLYHFITKILKYPNISIRLPHRVKDGYGIRTYHIDEVKKLGVSLVITVDNGITAVQEAAYAKELGIDMLITDHHTPLDTLPDSFVTINPKISSKYKFKDLAGVAVVFKLISAISNTIIKDKKLKMKIMNDLLPFVAIGSVADCVPLVGENRLLVQKWLEIINNPNRRPENISNLINFLNLKTVTSFHIWFVIGPRLNAGGRMASADDSLHCILQNGQSQIKYLENIEELNTKRRARQENDMKDIEEKLDLTQKVLVAVGETVHEWVVGIVAGRIAEKYNKPTVIMSIDKKKNIAVGSCRAPQYFSIIKMLNEVGKDGLLDRFGGHEQAWGLTIKLENLDKAINSMYAYGKSAIKEDKKEKPTQVDTEILEHDLKHKDIEEMHKLEPFGEGNREPFFLLKDLKVEKVLTMGKDKNHTKVLTRLWEMPVETIKWNGEKNGIAKKAREEDSLDIICKYRKNDFSGGYFFDIKEVL